MITITTHKMQGNGKDSWHVDVHDCATKEEATPQNRVSRDIVFTDPSMVQLIDISRADISSLTSQQIADLKNLLGI